MTWVTPEMVLAAYARGIFPMGENRGDPRLFWVDPELRGILPLDRFHLSHRLARTVRQGRFRVAIDTDFAAVIAACAAPRDDHPETWINAPIAELFTELHRRGIVHSVECWRDDMLLGGLYGVSLGAAFFGESMFSRATDASKVALVHLVARLRRGGYKLLDVQFVTSHLAQFGVLEIPRSDYRRRLAAALAGQADFFRAPVDWTPEEVLAALQDDGA